jgi:hypothetical protein
MQRRLVVAITLEAGGPDDVVRARSDGAAAAGALDRVGGLAARRDP